MSKRPSVGFYVYNKTKFKDFDVAIEQNQLHKNGENGFSIQVKEDDSLIVSLSMEQVKSGDTFFLVKVSDDQIVESEIKTNVFVLPIGYYLYNKTTQSDFQNALKNDAVFKEAKGEFSIREDDTTDGEYIVSIPELLRTVENAKYALVHFNGTNFIEYEL